MKTPLIALAALGSLALAGTAHAESMAIQYNDLNLSTEQGQKTLERRIDAAANKVCGAENARTGTRLLSREQRECVAEARAKAREQFAAIVEDRQLGG